MTPERIKELRQLILERHGCDSTHVASVPVRETFEDKTIWEGNVEVFHIFGLSDANACYAWHCRHDPTKVVTILEKPPVFSAGSAVRTVIAEKKEQP